MGCLGKLGLHRYADAACDGSHALLATQPAHSVIGVQGTNRNAECHDDRHYWNNIVAHTPLLLSRCRFSIPLSNSFHFEVRKLNRRSSMPVGRWTRPECEEYKSQ